MNRGDKYTAKATITWSANHLRWSRYGNEPVKINRGDTLTVIAPAQHGADAILTDPNGQAHTFSQGEILDFLSKAL